MKMKAFIVFWSIVFLHFYCFSQSSISKRAKKEYENGIQLIKERKFDKGITRLQKAIKISPKYSQAHYQLAFAYQTSFKKSLALQHFEKSVTYAKNKRTVLMAYVFLSENELKQGNYEKSLKYASQFLKLRPGARLKYFIQQLEKTVAVCNFAMENRNSENDLQKQRLPDEVNFFQRQYFPVLSIDGKRMYVTVQKRDGGNEDVYFSSYEKDAWTTLSAVETLNTPNNEGSCSISGAGETLFYSFCPLQNQNSRSNKTVGSCDLFYSTKKGKYWGDAKNMGAVVNTRFWESQPAVSKDGKYLIFTSNRPGGQGGKDLWKSENKGGVWSKPVNMGKAINTAGAEISPFLHENQTTLFFASNGHLGFGGYDLFQTDLSLVTNVSDTIKNLGYPINDYKDQLSLAIHKDKAYYADEAIDKKGTLRTFIYYFDIENKIEIKDEPLPKPQHIVKIEISPNSKAPLSYTVERYKKGITESYLDDVQGNRQFSTKEGGDYLVSLSVRGFNLEQKKITIPNLPANSEHILRFELTPIHVGDKMSFNNIYFETDSHTLKPEGAKVLNKIASFLQQNPKIKIGVYAHTDSVGSENYNLKLSNRRAESVKIYLRSKGISENKMVAKGFGETQVITEQTNEKNRRIEFEVLELVND